MQTYRFPLLFCLFLGFIQVGWSQTAQEKAAAEHRNIFLDRSFWKTAPTIEQVNEKIAEGNDPVELNPFAFDAVTYAILENTPLTTVKHLLAMEGNEVNKATHDGRNYLMWAAYKGNTELMQLLVDQGSKTDIVDDHGYNLMTFAAVAGQTEKEVYDLILENGGKPNDLNREGANALLLLSPHLKEERGKSDPIFSAERLEYTR